MRTLIRQTIAGRTDNLCDYMLDRAFASPLVSEFLTDAANLTRHDQIISGEKEGQPYFPNCSTEISDRSVIASAISFR